MLNVQRAALMIPLVLLALALCALGGCRASRLGNPNVETSPGGGEDSVQQPDDISQDIAAVLPAPSALLQLYEKQAGSKHTAYAETDLIRHGEDSVDFFPHKNITDVGNSVEFHPNWSDAAGKSQNNLSYCIYVFTPSGFDRTPRVRYGWSDPPEDLSTVWLGLANWGRDRWDWRQAEADGITSLPSMEPYMDIPINQVFIVMVHASMDVSALRYIGLGPKQVTADLRTAPKLSLPPVRATASSAASTTTVGTIARHEFDWDGDGVFEVDQGPVAASVYDVSATGDHSVSVRVSNSYGEPDTASDGYTVIDTWRHTWGLAGVDQLYAVTTDGTEYCYAAGYIESSTKGKQVILLKYKLTGELQWVRAWGGKDDDCAMDVQFYFDSIYVAGYTKNFGAGEKDVLLQCWDTDGTVLWTKTWGGNDDDTGTGVAITPGGVYVSGVERVSDADGDALLLKYSHDGNHQWAKSWAGFDTDKAEDVLSTYNLFTDSYYLNLTGYTKDFGGQTLVLYLQFNEAGALTIQKAWEAASGVGYSGNAITALGYPPKFYIAGDAGWWGKALLLEVGTGTTATAVTWGDIRTNAAYGLFHRDDHLVVCGATEWFDDDFDAFLVDISPTGGYQGSQVWRCAYNAHFHGIAPFPGTGALLAGAGTSADTGSWEPWSISLTPRDGTWSNLTGTVQSPAGVTASPTAGSVIVTNGVEDTGAGVNFYDDAALVSSGLP